MDCDMCGNNKGQFFTAMVEGTNMTVCKSCTRYDSNAKPIAKPLPTMKKSPQNVYQEPERGEMIQIIRSDYPKIIRQARDKLGLKQADLAKKLAEKESVLHSLEIGKHEPSMPLARKLEKHLRISLVEQHEEKKIQIGKRLDGPITIGDMLSNK